MAAAIHSKHLVVHGRVQGVGYRWSMVQAAQALGVKGWVRNRRDGTVEAVVVGDAAAVDALLEWARGGPAGAWVERVEVGAVREAAAEALIGFVQRDTV